MLFYFIVSCNLRNIPKEMLQQIAGVHRHKNHIKQKHAIRTQAVTKICVAESFY